MQHIEIDINNLTGKYVEMFNNVSIKGDDNPLELLYDIRNNKITKKANSIFSKNLILCMILYEDDKIIYERYRHPCTSHTPMFSWSMSKSLVGYTTIYTVPDITKNVSEYSNRLTQSVYRDISVENILKMSTGVMHKHYPHDVFWGLRNNILSTLEYVTESAYRNKVSNNKFKYKDINTHALVNMLEDMGGFEEQFEKFIWRPARTEFQANWLLDKHDTVIGSTGFSCTPRDWLRLAIYMMEQHNINPLIKLANSAHIYNEHPRFDGRYFDYYGYHVWVKDNSFWWLGSGGQRIAIDPIKKKIMVVLSCSEYFMNKIYNLFGEFERS